MWQLERRVKAVVICGKKQAQVTSFLYGKTTLPGQSANLCD